MSENKPRIHQAIENAMAIVGAIALGAIVAWFGINDHFRPKWEKAAAAAATKAFERQAVKDRAGEWTSDAEGAPAFQWAACTPLGTKK